MGFKKIDAAKLDENAIRLVGSDWMLITAGRPEKFNTMTANWGGMGYLWNKPVCFCVVRPTRHTFGFIDREERFTLSFFDKKKHKKALDYCGAHSGREVDKVKETGLTPVFEDNAIYFSEARIVMVCRKIYSQDLDPSRFLDPGIEKFYPKKDYHRVFIGEIASCLSKK